jgi:hypothetical protein
MRAFVSDFEGPQRVLKVPNGVPRRVVIKFISRLVIKRGLELMTSIVGSTFRKEEAGVRFPPLASSLP